MPARGVRRHRAFVAGVLAAVLAAGCGARAPAAAPGGSTTSAPSAISGAVDPASATASPSPIGAPGPVPPATAAGDPPSPPGAPAPPAAPASTRAAAGTLVEVAYRLERRTADAATAGFEAFTQATLSDPRGWARAGFRLVARPNAPLVIVLAEGPEVDALCLPYDTYGRYSCQNGPTVALNADRWRTATSKWTGSLDDYRRYLVGHEVGHLLGLRHPRVQCPAPGRPAPLMAQQSTELDGCLPNPWPLPGEVELGRRRPADLAPPYGR